MRDKSKNEKEYMQYMLCYKRFKPHRWCNG